MKKIIFLFIFFILNYQAKAGLELGAGLSSAFVGRYVPVATIGITGQGWAWTASTGGVNNSYYFHSSYGTSFYFTKDVGTLFGGTVNFGGGIGSHFAFRGFQDEDSSYYKKKNDFVIGPSFKVNYSFLSSVFISVEALYGLSSNIWAHMNLNSRDIVVTSIGLRLW